MQASTRTCGRSAAEESCLCSEPVRGRVRRTGRIFPEYVERRFLDPEHSFVAVQRTPWTRFAKQKFIQLRTNYVRRTFFRFDQYPEQGSRSKSSPNLERVLDRERPLFLKQCAWRQKLETNWTPRDDSSGSMFEPTVADVSDPLTPSHSKFSGLLFAVCVDVCWYVNPNFLEYFVVFNGTRDGVGPYKCSFSLQ